MSVVVGYIPNEYGDAALDEAFAEAQRRGTGVIIVNTTKGDALIERVRAVVHAHAPAARVEGMVSGEAFLTPPGAFSTLVAEAIERHVAIVPELSTTGGTSDARFLSRLCPTVEFGLLNATMHKVDEAVAIDDLRTLVAIYADIAASALAR